MKKFYDTCALLDLQESAFNQEVFMISSITLKELENIKTSANKDADIKFKARNILRLLSDNQNCYEVIPYCNNFSSYLEEFNTLSDNNDSKIIITAYHTNKAIPVTFITADLSCFMIARTVLPESTVQLLKEKQQDYFGYRTLQCINDDQFAATYTNLYNSENWKDMNINEYLFIIDKDNNIVDKYKYTKEGFKEVPFICFDSKIFGKIKPKDDYQLCAMDSLKNNKITMLRGSAGTGKSYLAIGYLFSLLEKEKIDKIVIFCNTVATAGSAKLGYYPGSRTEKLLDAQIGNFLSSKLGDRAEVERLISENKLELLPLSDIRGYDTTGLNAGIYITEAQNLDIQLLKLALQRIGEDSICILDGDTKTQVDLSLYAGVNNGMMRASEVFRNRPIYGEITLKNIYRSEIAQIAELM